MLADAHSLPARDACGRCCGHASWRRSANPDRQDLRPRHARDPRRGARRRRRHRRLRALSEKPAPRLGLEPAARSRRARGRGAHCASRSSSMPTTRRSTRSSRRFDPDLLQLHGAETPERVAAIRARFGRPVMKAIGIAEAADLAARRRLSRRRRPAPPRRQAAARRGRAARRQRRSPSTGGCSPALTASTALHAVGRPRRRDNVAAAIALTRRRARRRLVRASRAGPATRTRTRSRPSSRPRARPSPRLRTEEQGRRDRRRRSPTPSAPGRTSAAISACSAAASSPRR